MNYIIHFCVFIIVLLVYLHIQSHFRSADGTDVFELDGVIESRIDDVLDLKQPVVFRTRFDATLGDDINAYAVLRHIPQVDVSVVDAEHGTRVNVSLESFVKWIVSLVNFLSVKILIILFIKNKCPAPLLLTKIVINSRT